MILITVSYCLCQLIPFLVVPRTFDPPYSIVLASSIGDMDQTWEMIANLS